MARIRTVKPSFFTSLKVAEIRDPWTRLLFIGLWTHSDDEGRFMCEPRVIKGALFPLEESITHDDVDRMIGDLHALNLVDLYLNGARKYGSIPGWTEHQKINRPTASTLPALDDDGSFIIPAQAPFTEDSLSAHGGLTEDSLTEGKGREGKGRECADGALTEDSLSAHGGLTEQKPERPRNPMWDALSEHFPEPLTKTEKSNRGRIIRELTDAGATPDDVHARVAEHRRRRLHWDLTENALNTHWAELAPRRNDGDDISSVLGYRFTGSM